MNQPSLASIVHQRIVTNEKNKNRRVGVPAAEFDYGYQKVLKRKSLAPDYVRMLKSANRTAQAREENRDPNEH